METNVRRDGFGWRRRWGLPQATERDRVSGSGTGWEGERRERKIRERYRAKGLGNHPASQTLKSEEPSINVVNCIAHTLIITETQTSVIVLFNEHKQP